MSDQINVKLDPKLKRQAEALAKQLGLNLSGVIRAFLYSFVRTKHIELSLNEPDAGSDTPFALTGKELEQKLRTAGYSAKYAKEHGSAYDKMVEEERAGSLIEF